MSNFRELLFGTLKKTFRTLLVMAAFAGVMVGIAPSPASASATWCLPTSQVRVMNISVPTGQYCFSVIGSGTRVDRTTGSWNGYIIANAAEKVSFVDRNGNTYQTFNTYRRDGFSYSYRYWQSAINGTARVGSVCGEMLAAGVTIGKICHRVG